MPPTSCALDLARATNALERYGPRMLDMKTSCERCEAALEPGGEARICSYECTFCPACSDGMSATCPNCGGELLARPRRAT